MTPAPALRNPIEAAMALRAQGRLQEALQLLSAPGEYSPDFYTLRGDLQLELELIREAAGSYFTVIAAEPDNVYAQSNLAHCLLRLERWERAAEAFQRVLDLDSHRDQIRIGLGDCLLHLNRFEEALACFDLCWSDAARTQALFGKAVALQMLRHFDEAEAAYQRLLAIDPKREEALSNLVAMSMEMFDTDRVQRYSLRLLEVRPQSLVALQGLAVVAIERREHEDAGRYLARIAEQSAASRAPGNEPPDDGSIEYRVSREMIDYLDETWRSLSEQPARRALNRY